MEKLNEASGGRLLTTVLQVEDAVRIKCRHDIYLSLENLVCHGYICLLLSLSTIRGLRCHWLCFFKTDFHELLSPQPYF